MQSLLDDNYTIFEEQVEIRKSYLEDLSEAMKYLEKGKVRDVTKLDY